MKTVLIFALIVFMSSCKQEMRILPDGSLANEKILVTTIKNDIQYDFLNWVVTDNNTCINLRTGLTVICINDTTIQISNKDGYAVHVLAEAHEFVAMTNTIVDLHRRKEMEKITILTNTIQRK